MVPLTMILLGAALAGKTKHVSLLDNLKSTVTKPLVWAPVLGAVLVLLGVKLPDLALSSIKLIGENGRRHRVIHAGSDVERLTPSLDRSAVSVVLLKNFLQPVLGLGLALAFHFSGNLPKGIVIAAACPRYRERDAGFHLPHR